MAGIVNKVKEVFSSSDKHDNVDNPHSHNSGPHSSAAANKADPLVDSDRDHRNAGLTGTHTTGTHTGTGLTGTHGTHTGTTGLTGTHGSSGLTGTHGSTTAGPHDSNLLNKADPRVDSDRDGYNAAQRTANTSGTHTTGTHTGTGLTGTHGTHTGTHHNTSGLGATGLGANSSIGQHGEQRADNAGPHNSNLLNKIDPRVDSDRDGYNAAQRSANTTGTHTGTGLTGNHGSTTAGPHDSNLLNKADPRVDSDRDGYNAAQRSANTTGTHGTHTGAHGTSGLTGTHGTHTGTGAGLTGTSGAYGSSNDGPHNSNLLNKADPRVDSDRDGYNAAQRSANTTGTHTGTGLTGTHGTHTGTGAGLTGSSGAYGSTTQGPHDSNLLNKADPRVDSDGDGRNAAQRSANTTGTHGTHTGAHGTSGLTGTHAGLGNTQSVHSSTTGPADGTAGPHSSNLLNKLDPRVDSDLSKQNAHQ